MTRWLTALFVLLMLLASGAHAAEMPPEIAALLSLPPDAVVEGWQQAHSVLLGEVGYALVRQDGLRTLYGFQRTQQGWACDLETARAVPQGEAKQVLLGLSDTPRQYDSLWYDPARHDFTYPNGLRLTVSVSDGEAWTQSVTCVIRAGAMELTGYQDSAGCQVEIVEDKLVFFGVGTDGAQWSSRTFSTDITRVDFAGLPRRPDAQLPGEIHRDNPLYTELTGLWQWRADSPATALGDGVYFHVDGRCALYDAAGYDGAWIDELRFREWGAWTVQGDLLLVTTMDAVHVLPVQVMSWQDWDDSDGLSIGGGAYVPASWQAMGLSVEPLMPVQVLEDVRDWRCDAVIEDYAELPNVPVGPMALVLLRDGDARLVYLYTLDEDGRWHFFEDTRQIPQVQPGSVWLSASKGGQSYSGLWYDEHLHDDVYPDAPGFGVWTSNGETYGERVEYIWQEDAYHRPGFRLIHYGDDPVTQIDVVGDELVFYNISSGFECRVWYAFDRRMGAVDYAALPREVSGIRLMGGDEPALPVTDRPPVMGAQPFLHKQDVTLREGRYPVYMGPGKAYGRAAGGKAAVSTGGWVQVFGEYDGWLLIHYAISAEQYRFGWIDDSALARGERAEPLDFCFGDFVSSEPGTPLMEDPLNSKTPLLAISAEADIEYLAQLGGAYSYVRVLQDGQVYWGFVYTWPLGHG